MTTTAAAWSSSISYPCAGAAIARPPARACGSNSPSVRAAPARRSEPGSSMRRNALLEEQPVAGPPGPVPGEPMAAAVARLRAADLRVTAQRMAVLMAVEELGGHPDAEALRAH